MSASEAWCFARYFCLLIDLVDEGYAYVGLLHMLLDILDIIFAPKIILSITHRLEEVISRHHQVFL